MSPDAPQDTTKDRPSSQAQVAATAALQSAASSTRRIAANTAPHMTTNAPFIHDLRLMGVRI